MAVYSLTKEKSQSTVKSLQAELTNLNPSAIITLFELDLTSLMKANEILNFGVQADSYGLKTPDVSDNIIRVHNSINIFKSHLVWRGRTYYPAPIQGEGFEVSSRGTLPTPELSIATHPGEGETLLGLLRYQIRKFGDIIGAKVTRVRTFAKYLDVENFQNVGENGQAVSLSSQTATENLGEIPQGFEPDPYAELPRDIYYIERKTTENKSILKYQLTSSLDVEGLTLPKRTIISDRCMWQYRGPGCWYQHPYEEEELQPVATIWEGAGAGNWSQATGMSQIISAEPPKDVGPTQYLKVEPTNQNFYEGYVFTFSGGTFTLEKNIDEYDPESSNLIEGNEYSVGTTQLFGLSSGTINSPSTPAANKGTINYSYDSLTSTANNANVAATRAGSAPNNKYSIAFSPTFGVKQKEVYRLNFRFVLNSGSAPRIQIVNATTVDGKVGVKEGWSNHSVIEEGSNSILFTINENAPVATVAGNAFFQIWNTSNSNWEITEVSCKKLNADIPILIKAQLSQDDRNFLLPSEAPPVATDNDERVINIIKNFIRLEDRGKWSRDAKTPDGSNAYLKGDYVYLFKDNMKYYFVAKDNISQETNKKFPPPNETYWIADECSKSLAGCRMRWGSKGAVQKNDGCGCVIGGNVSGNKGGLPYGGFPAARKVQSQR